MTKKEEQLLRSTTYNLEQEKAQQRLLQALLAKQRKTRVRLKKIKYARRSDQVKTLVRLAEHHGLLWAEEGWLDKRFAELAALTPPLVPQMPVITTPEEEDTPEPETADTLEEDTSLAETLASDTEETTAAQRTTKRRGIQYDDDAAEEETA